MTDNAPDGTTSLSQQELIKLKRYLRNYVSRQMEGSPPGPEDPKQAVASWLEQAYAQTQLNLDPNLRQSLFQEVINDVFGFGPIQPLLEDPEVTEIMVNGPRSVYVEQNGRLEKTKIIFEDDAHVISVIERIVSPLGRQIDYDHPSVDARLPDGSRVNAIIPPVAIDGPSITIRKFKAGKLGVDELISLRSLTEGMAEFLRACVISRLNILVSGGTGSGKTTLLNVLSGFIPKDERIVTIEDAAELKLHQDHVVRLETKPGDVDGRGAVTIRDLVRNSLRMRPDRIIVGEVRGGEALDMLQAMNTGHDGSLTTLHANNPRDAISRLETMAMMAGLEMPLRVIREQIASAVDLIVQLSRLRDGTRKVTYVTEVAGMEGDVVVLTDVFQFKQTGVSPDGKVIGDLKPTGIRPLFMHRLEAAGFKLPPSVFGVGERGVMDSPSHGRGRRR